MNNAKVARCDLSSRYYMWCVASRNSAFFWSTRVSRDQLCSLASARHCMLSKGNAHRLLDLSNSLYSRKSETVLSIDTLAKGIDTGCVAGRKFTIIIITPLENRISSRSGVTIHRGISFFHMMYTVLYYNSSHGYHEDIFAFYIVQMSEFISIPNPYMLIPPIYQLK